VSTEPGSLETAFRAEAARYEPAVIVGGGSSEQLELLRGDDGKLPQDAFRKLRAQRGRGRPAGHGNKRNVDLAKLICQTSGDPLIFLSSVYATELDQLVEMLLIAEGVPEREDRLYELMDRFADKVSEAVRGGMTADAAKSLEHAAFLLEKAAVSLKTKPGEIALKALAHQITAAKETAPYVHSKKPIEQNVTVRSDGTIFMPAPQTSAADPIDAVMRRTVEAIQGGEITAEQITELRFNPGSGAFEVAGDGEGEE
jgi:hypothetical protein